MNIVMCAILRYDENGKPLTHGEGSYHLAEDSTLFAVEASKDPTVAYVEVRHGTLDAPHYRYLKVEKYAGGLES